MTPVPRPTRAFLLLLLGIVAIGLAVRGYYIEQVASGLSIKGDAYTYHWLANLIADGKGFTSPWKYILGGVDEPTAEHPPLYPLYLSGFSWLGLDSVGNHRLASSLLGCGTVAAVGFLGRRVAGDRAGLAAAAIAAVYPLMVVTDGIVHSESLYGLLIAMSLIAAYRFRERPVTARAALLGAVLGLAALTRSEALVLLPLLVLPLAWRAPGRRLRLAAVAFAAFVVVISPWVVRSSLVFDQPVGLSNNLGGLLAGANCEATYHGDFIGLWRLDCLGPADGDEADRAAVYRSEGIEYARDHAGRLLVVAPIRVLRSFDLYRPNQQATYEAFAEDRDLDWERVGIAFYYCLVGLAIYGIVLLRRRGQPLWILLAPFVTVVLVSLYGLRHHAPALCGRGAAGGAGGRGCRVPCRVTRAARPHEASARAAGAGGSAAVSTTALPRATKRPSHRRRECRTRLPRLRAARASLFVLAARDSRAAGCTHARGPPVGGELPRLVRRVHGADGRGRDRVLPHLRLPALPADPCRRASTARPGPAGSTTRGGACCASCRRTGWR